ncbi:AAA family ATPase [Edaphobacter albus]|uniref:AAA family ATPase n=1 Tax=Edaphobacter sp. 4G125 TaxID=2763071 RepID=UPI001648F54D|nr:AAA family ATPase [Edaphobacter sp. 4G125]QNI36029.1 AAA family ATPase [Edaphobacter sp. 4G125]
MFRPGEIIILTGTPGSGKTTAANNIAQLPGSPKVHLHSDDFWHFIKAGSIPPWQSDAHSQNATVIDVLAGAAARYAKGDYFVLVDGIIGPWFLDAFQNIGAILHYIVLRPDLEEAIRRCRERGGDTLSDPVSISALHQQFGNLGVLKNHSLSVAGLSADETCEAIGKAVKSQRFRLR